MNITICLGANIGGTVDASCVKNGNPGVGGTQFCMLQLAHYLNTHGNYKVNIIAFREFIVEAGINFYLVNSVTSLFETIKECNTEVLIVKDFSNDIEYKHKLVSIDIPIVVWTHNYKKSDFCKFVTKSPQIKAQVFVGKQQYDRYIDDNVINKSTYIYNMFTDNTPNVVRENDSKTVVYMGALVEGKGFAELCKIWKGIVNAVPEAKLIVLGNGKLYGESKLGKYMLADEKYERKFIKYITDENGHLLPSIEFLGVIGEGKTEIFRKTSVGVVNPSGQTETFGMGILEMAEAKLPVVTIGKNGYFDTVQHEKTGILAKNLQDLQSHIIELLKNSQLNTQYGESAKVFIKQFNPELIGKQWDTILREVYNNSFIPTYATPSPPYSNNYKWVRCITRFLRFRLHLKFIPSFVQIESILYKILKG